MRRLFLLLVNQKYKALTCRSKEKIYNRSTPLINVSVDDDQYSTIFWFK